MPDTYTQVPANSTGNKIAAWEEVVATNTVQSQYSKIHESATFYAIFDRIVPAANKYMATLFNTLSTRRVRVWRVWAFNWQIAAVTGTVLDEELRYVTARTVGTSITPQAADSADTITSGITADHATTAVTEASGGLLRRFTVAGEEMKIGAITLETSLTGSNPMSLVFDCHARGVKPITLRQNRGLTCKNITGTVGSVSYVYEFTDEPV